MRPKFTKKQKCCTKCGEEKKISQFYFWKNPAGTRVFKSECKPCTISRNALSSKKRRAPRKRSGNPIYQEYQRIYYSLNKEKFKHYRTEFKERHPDYHKNLYWKAKEAMTIAKEALKERDIV